MKTIAEAVKSIVEQEYGSIAIRQNGILCYEMFADYRDEIDSKTVTEILETSDPRQTLFEKIDDWYFDQRCDYEDELLKIIATVLTDSESEFYQGEEYEPEEDELKECMWEEISFEPPISHFLKQTFKVNIMVDTGDGNYDYTLNSVYPCYCGKCGTPHDPKAAIVWLAKQQGYKKGEFRKAMEEGDIANPKGFLQSMRQELANLPSHMSTLTFLAEMSLEDLISLNELIKLQDRNGHFYDTTCNPYCGYIIIDKKAETGLYDPWSGGGSCFEIELEKDVKLPIRFIRSALPDGGDGNYSIGEVYGMCGSCWRNVVKTIHAPKGEYSNG